MRRNLYKITHNQNLHVGVNKISFSGRRHDTVSRRQSLHGFTLIELLVVIVIIALMMSTLLPGLGRVKKVAQQTVCMAHLGHWGLIHSLYAEDHGGHFFAGCYEYTDPNGNHYQSTDGDLWMVALEPYYEFEQMLICRSGGEPWQWKTQAGREFEGSYGINGWICDPPAEVLQNQGHSTSNNWRIMHAVGIENAPLMADCVWFTGLPESSDAPPDEELRSDSFMTMPAGMPGGMPGFPGDVEEYAQEDSGLGWITNTHDHMQRFCITRHTHKSINPQINMVFFDGRAEGVPLKSLWRLKWHRNFDAQAPLPEWPGWMQTFREPRP